MSLAVLNHITMDNDQTVAQQQNKHVPTYSNQLQLDGRCKSGKDRAS